MLLTLGSLRALKRARSPTCSIIAARSLTGSAHSEPFDIVVVGGGLVGSAVAAALGANSTTSHLKVAVLDRQEPPLTQKRLPEHPELRVSTITPASIQLLQKVVDWQDVAPPRSAAFQQMQVWDWGGNGFVKYHASDAGRDLMGYVVENSVLHTAFLRRLHKPGRPPVFQPPAQLEGLRLPAYKSTRTAAPLAELHLKDGRSLHAKLVIGADGARSQVRSFADLRTVGWPYHQRAVVATVATSPTNETAHQRFLETGPLALLPVRDGYSNVVWSTTPTHAQELEGCTSGELAGRINEALHGGRQPRSTSGSRSIFSPPPEILENVGSRPRSFPLVLAHAGRYVRPRLALVGDAAHSVHPLAGQGVNLGFGDVEALVETLQHAVECGRDIGDLTLLEEMYEKPRQRANVSMMASLDALKRIYEPQEGWLASARQAGLALINRSDSAKRQIMKVAMGL